MAKLPTFLSHADNTAVAAATTLTVTSANSTYPGSNLKLLPISKVWRSATGALSNVDINLDFGSAKVVELLALVNHNLSSTAAIAIAAGTTSAVSDFSTTIIWREFDAFKLLSPAQSYRYWRFRITDASSADNYIEVGYVIAGDATQLAAAFDYGWTQIDEYENQEVQSEFGVPYVDEMFYRMRFRFMFKNRPASEITSFRSIFRGVKRNVTPLFFIPDHNVNDGYFGRFVSHLERQMDYLTIISTLEFLEDSRGKKIAA